MKKVLMLVMVFSMGLAAVPAGAEVFYEVWDSRPADGLMTSWDWSTAGPPVETGTIANFGVGPRAGSDVFTFRQTAYLYLEQAADYAFWVRSDDAGWVFVDGILVARWDGDHASGEIPGRSGGTDTADGDTDPNYFAMAAGFHVMEVWQSENAGGEVLEVRYEAPALGIATTLIPDSILWASPYAKIDPANLAYPVDPAPSLAVAPPNGAEDVDESAVVLEWTPVTGATGYNVYFAAGRDPNLITEQDLIASGPGLTADLNALGVGPLAIATRYFWRVDAVVGGDVLPGLTHSFETYSEVPEITEQPQDVALYEGCPATFAAAATAGVDTVSYQWYDGVGALAGETNLTLTTGVAGAYHVVATNDRTGETAQSRTATFTIAPADLLANLMGTTLGNPYAGQSQSHTIGGNGSITITASGGDIWDNNDRGYFLNAPLIGDGEIIARVASIQATNWDYQNTNAGQGWIKVGVMMRESLAHDAAHAFMCTTSRNGDAWQGRRVAGTGINGSANHDHDFTEPRWVRIVRQGNSFTGYHKGDADAEWTLGATDNNADAMYNPLVHPYPLNGPVYVGLAATSHDDAATVTAVFDNVQIIAYAAGNPTPQDGATNIDPTQDIVLDWDPVASAPCPEQYALYISENDPNVGGAIPVSVDDSTYTIPAGTYGNDSTIYWRVETIGGAGQGPVWSFDMIKIKPVITEQPESVLIPEGTDGALAISADNYDSLQWYGPAGAVAEGTGLRLDLAAASDADAGEYYCVASNANGSTESDKATVSIGHLIAYYPLDGDPNDQSGRPHDKMQTVNTATGSVSYVPGLLGDAASFTGGAYLTEPNAANWANGLSGITISAWVKSNRLDVDKGFIILQNPAGNDDFGMRYDRRGANGNPDPWDSIKIGLHVTDTATNNGIMQLEASEFSQTTEWQHLVMTWQAGSPLTLYIDGEYHEPDNNRGAKGGVTQSATDLNLGRGGKYNDGGGDFAGYGGGWDGLVDEVRIYDYALDAEAVARLHLGIMPDATLCVGLPEGDLDGDCSVTLKDFAIWAQGWGWCELLPSMLCE